MQAAKHWEDLRRQARVIENEVDSKLLSFSKLATNEIRDDHADTTPLLDTSQEVFREISAEIEHLLTQLVEINNQMSECCKQLQNQSAMYTLQRHNDILNDYNKEFKKTKSSVMAQMERNQLLLPVKRVDDFKSVANSRMTDLYLKEQEHIRSSERMVDEQIEIAMRTRENLMTQRTAFKAIQTQMTTLANRFPMINSLIHRINIKRRKDSIVIGAVIAICLFIFILFKF
ncbi:Golgi SNAP receptor complex member 1-like protein [Leptotrombidium deliense]|uniref:Golgi SNAP receptor complex member 1 n=1 Tax=Leptotrombidium deliense TaxID=299467 RepID=A0A443SWH4_9ACAR|nr:Golgi SNAP receptor complex member 1-like protein [Leptotrombidium deliense]